MLAEFRNPVGIITKNRLVTRDIDVLADLAADRVRQRRAVGHDARRDARARARAAHVDPADLRLDAVARLNAAGMPAGVMVAPVIPA